MEIAKRVEMPGQQLSHGLTWTDTAAVLFRDSRLGDHCQEVKDASSGGENGDVDSPKKRRNFFGRPGCDAGDDRACCGRKSMDISGIMNH